MQISPPIATFFLCFICAALTASAQTGSRTAQPVARNSGSATTQSSAPSLVTATNERMPDLQVLITGLEAAQRANHAHMVPFTVTREYELFSGNDQQPTGTVVAEVHFQPPATKTWQITQASGNARAERVVKNVLEREVKYARDGKIAISSQDYDFRYVGTGESDHRSCYILELIPKSSDGNLLRGRIWVDRDTYLIHHFEGEPAKSPSWWVKDLKLSTTYNDMGGMWLQAVSKGTADIRLCGPHTMTARTLTYRVARPVVEGPAAELTRLTRPQPPYPRRPSPAAAVGVGVITVR
jgi:hypothetical protein